MQAHICEQRSAEWYALRVGIPTASDFSKLITSDGTPSKTLPTYAMTLAAEKFAGKAVQHCGPFYFWGNAVPAIFPRESYRVQKGIDMGSGGVAKMFKTSPEKIREYNTLHRWSHREKISEAARAAEIPHEIASYVASTNFIPA